MQKRTRHANFFSLPHRSAFTVVELLVVMLIIALLAALILGAVHHAQKSSKIAKTKADLAAISTAIEQYHSDFKFYPGLPDPPAGTPIQHTILAQALIGPGLAIEDGADGPGFRIPDPSTGKFDPNSKKWDAYLSTEHFKVQRFARGWGMLDYFGNPIIYYPKRRNLNAKLPNILVDNQPAASPSTCIFDLRDGEHPQSGFPAMTLDSFQVVVGDADCSDSIDGNENLLVEGNFVLGSPGPDGSYTIYVKGEAPAVRHQKGNKSDDIFNFDR